MKARFLILLVLNSMIFCKQKNIKEDIIIMQNPVFSEIDTFNYSVTKRNFSRHDYFLVKGDLKSKDTLRNLIKEFVNLNIKTQRDKYSNYIMFFYKDSRFVNKQIIDATSPEYRYKVFQDNNENSFIASCYCSDFMHTGEIRYQNNY